MMLNNNWKCVGLRKVLVQNMSAPLEFPKYNRLLLLLFLEFPMPGCTYGGARCISLHVCVDNVCLQCFAACPTKIPLMSAFGLAGILSPAVA